MHINEITDYIMQAYEPETIIVYGSFSDGTNGEHSDFDALAVTRKPHPAHDESVIGGITLDVFLYSPEELRDGFSPEKFPQLYGGKVFADTNGLGAKLIAKVRAFIDAQPLPSRAEAAQAVAWCEKMLLRTARGDAEGYFRWHWLLTESLEIYFDARGWRYFGPKKAINRLKADAPDDYACYANALSVFSPDALTAWVNRLRAALEQTLSE